jgi:FkbM family methyltransferase
MKARLLLIGGQKIWCRRGTREDGSDIMGAREVLEKKVYRRLRDGFDVMPGEVWLDLGANIGAFAVYCRSRGARAVCFEPEPDCYKILLRNASGMQCQPYAVTASCEKELSFSVSANSDNHYRGTVLPVKNYKEHKPVLNCYAGDLVKFCVGQKGGGFDGVKMDIEGSEGPIIDEWLLPRCDKLVMELHTSRDASFENLQRRLQILRKRFKNLKYPSMFETGKGFPPCYDQIIFAWDAK